MASLKPARLPTLCNATEGPCFEALQLDHRALSCHICCCTKHVQSRALGRLGSLPHKWLALSKQRVTLSVSKAPRLVRLAPRLQAMHLLKHPAKRCSISADSAQQVLLQGRALPIAGRTSFVVSKNHFTCTLMGEESNGKSPIACSIGPGARRAPLVPAWAHEYPAWAHKYRYVCIEDVCIGARLRGHLSQPLSTWTWPVQTWRTKLKVVCSVGIKVYICAAHPTEVDLAGANVKQYWFEHVDGEIRAKRMCVLV